MKMVYNMLVSDYDPSAYRKERQKMLDQAFKDYSAGETPTYDIEGAVYMLKLLGIVDKAEDTKRAVSSLDERLNKLARDI